MKTFLIINQLILLVCPFLRIGYPYEDSTSIREFAETISVPTVVNILFAIVCSIGIIKNHPNKFVGVLIAILILGVTFVINMFPSLAAIVSIFTGLLLVTIIWCKLKGEL